LWRDGYVLFSTRTSASGVYRFTNLDPGGRWDLQVADGTSHATQYWPAAPTRSLGTALSVTSGGTTTADADVTRPADLSSISGDVVSGSDGTTPLAGIQVRLVVGNVWLRTTTTDGLGHFLVGGLLPGTYTVRLVDPSGTHWGWWDEVVVVDGSSPVLA